MDTISQFIVLGEVIVAVVLGGIIGYERSHVGKPAGTRTYMFIAAATCMILNMAFVAASVFAQDLAQNVISADPIKAFEAIVVGVSFIGGGIIIKNEQEQAVHNLTTAASILLTASVGIACALQQFIVAGGITVMAIFINHVLLRAKHEA